jgi:hypothetical protein
MAAHVHQGPDLGLLVAYEDHRFGPQIDDEIIAGPRDRGHMTRAEPVTQQDLAHVALEYRGVGVELARERVAGAMAREERHQVRGSR